MHRKEVTAEVCAKARNKRKGANIFLHRSEDWRMFFSGRLLGLFQEETIVVFYTRMARDAVRLCGKKWETQKGLTWSKHPSVSKVMEQTDVKSSNSLKASPTTRAGVMRIPTIYAILGKPRSKLQMWNFDPITWESRNWSNEKLQGREVHAKESHKDNSLSEKAAQKIREAGNCELYKTKFQATHCRYLLEIPKNTMGRCTHSWKMTEGCTKALTQLEILLRDELELRFKIPHKGIVENQNKSMLRETEKD